MMRYHIDRNAAQSAYLQLYHQLRRDIVGGVYPPVCAADTRSDEITVRLQLPDAAADAVNAVLADTGKALHGVVPILRQGQHEGDRKSVV